MSAGGRTDGRRSGAVGDASLVRGRRSELPDGIFHVTTRGVDSCLIYRDELDRISFLRLFANVVERFRWRTYAFCLMGTHYHIVLETARARLSDGAQRLNGVYAQRFNRRHGRTGHLFGDRFASWVVDDEDHLAAACRYVLENPVRAGLCDSPEQWRWSGRGNVRSVS